jgi:hypothetical protein
MNFGENLDASSANLQSNQSIEHTDSRDADSFLRSPGACDRDAFPGPSPSAILAPARLEKGKGAESEAVRRELARMENWDLLNYSRTTSIYSQMLIRMLGAFNTVDLLQFVKEVETSSNAKCPRVYKRSEPLMVKWLWYRREHLLRTRPVAPCAVEIPAPLPKAPVVVAASAVTASETNDPLTAALLIDAEYMEDYDEFENA